jgi:hypothetical protein
MEVTLQRVPFLHLLCALVWLVPSNAEQQFPKPRVSTTLLEGDWIASPIVAVGEVTNVASYGEQTIDQLPPPTMRDIHRLFWCVGDFQTVAVVKGTLRAPTKRYLWASTIPGCRLWDADPRLVYRRFKTRAWFLREEGEFLRPSFDYGTYHFVGLFTSWEDGPRLPAQQRLGALLLTPSANSDTLENYAHYLWDVGDIACELIGKQECTRRIRDLAGLGNPKLREAACGFLKGQLKEENCDSR